MDTLLYIIIYNYNNLAIILSVDIYKIRTLNENQCA